MSSLLQSEEHVSPHAPPSQIHEEAEPPSPLLERVEPYTLYVFDQLFPGQHGLRVLAGLLRHASVKQLALPEFGLTDVGDVAVITVQNLRLLSNRIGIGYDTLEKYIVVLDRLRLFYKKRFRRQIALYFPLGRYQPPEPGVLEEIQALRPKSQKYCYRPKVRSFADQVKRRFVLLYPGGSGAPSISIAPAHQGESPQLPDLLMEDIRHIVCQEVDSDVASRLLRKVEGAVRYRCTHTQSRLLAPKGDSDASVSDSESRHSISEDDSDGVQHRTGEADRSSESPLLPQKGGSDMHMLDTFSQESRLFVIDGDSDTSTSHDDSCLPAPKGDSDLQHIPSESPLYTQKGDSDAHPSSESTPKRRLSLVKDDSLSEKGDSDTSDNDEAAHNVNVLLRKKIELLNVNVMEVAEFLCFLFNEHPKKKGYYKHLRDTQNCRNVEAWLGATLETILAVQRQRSDAVTKPGGYFYKRCIALHQEGIPSQTQHLIQQYGTLSYQQLLARLQHAPIARSVPSPSSALPSSPGAGQGSYPHTSVNAMTRTIPRLPREQPGMTREAYETIIASLKMEPQTQHMRYSPYQQLDTSIIVLIEDFVGHQRWIRSLDEWQQCLPTIQRSLWPSQAKTATSAHTY